jgi:uncharacterized protein YecE (DUF72 family)
VANDWDDGDEPELADRGSGYVYLRLRRSSYLPADLDRWAGRLEAVLASGSDAFVFFRHDEDGQMALHAESLLDRLGAFPVSGG